MIGCCVGLIIGGPDGRRSFSCSSIARALFFFISRHMPVKFCVIDRPGSVASVVRSERERQQTVADGNTTVVSISTALCTVTHALQQSKCKHTEYITHKLLNTTQPAYLYDNLSPTPSQTRTSIRYSCSGSNNFYRILHLPLQFPGASTGGKWTQLASSLAQGGKEFPPQGGGRIPPDIWVIHNL